MDYYYLLLPERVGREQAQDLFYVPGYFAQPWGEKVQDSLSTCSRA